MQCSHSMQRPLQSLHPNLESYSLPHFRHLIYSLESSILDIVRFQHFCMKLLSRKSHNHLINLLSCLQGNFLVTQYLSNMQLLQFPFNIQKEKYYSSIPILKPFNPSLQSTKIFFNLQIFLQFCFYFAQFFLVAGMWLYFQLYFLDLYHIFYGGNFLKNISIGRSNSS